MAVVRGSGVGGGGLGVSGVGGREKVEGMVWDCYKQGRKKVLLSTWRSFLPSSVQLLQSSSLQYIIF